jgi:hypothetical protein
MNKKKQLKFFASLVHIILKIGSGGILKLFEDEE